MIELQATPETPGAFYPGLRLMALDGFVVDVADSPDNARIFGRPGSGRGPAAFPQARVLALCEVGTHVRWRTLTKPCRRGEVPMARRLVDFLRQDMLLLWDRGFLSYGLVRQVRRRRAQLLARIKNNLVFRPRKRLRDGSYLARLYPSPQHRERDEGGVVVRIIEYAWNDPGRSGSGRKHRLLTTLLDAGRHPARRLIVLYHARPAARPPHLVAQLTHHDRRGQGRVLLGRHPLRPPLGLEVLHPLVAPPQPPQPA